jgi:MerR family transcriptional regulator/heat shock protein HspR
MRSPVPELYLISVAASMLDMHPQTLRKYERLGLVRPMRSLGSMRVYTRAELERLRLIKTLVEDEGINLAGVQRLLSIAEVAGRLRPLAVEPRAHRTDAHRRLHQEFDELFRLLGLRAESRPDR